MKKLESAGFTIIELMIATAVFAIILVITTTTIIGISDSYIKGSTQDQTQQSARQALTDISQDIQFSQVNGTTAVTASSSPDVYYFCVGNNVYVYTLDKELSSNTGSAQYSPYVLVRYQSTTDGCPAASSIPNITTTAPSTQFEELLSANERLGQLTVTKNSGNGYVINITVAFGDNDLLNDTCTGGTTVNPITQNNNINGDTTQCPGSKPNYNYECESGSDSSFCAVSTLTTTVEPRIN